ncbi:MAG TPA: hypothetical protein VEI99_09875 [Terriglobales bacterium]|nr:hypothetical protein [Terriglobales bacterium]
MMATIGQNLLVVAATVIGSLLFLAGLNRVWPQEKRRTYNDLIGWQLSILGTTYAVILGFMLYTVWTTYAEADLNVDLEANAVMNVYRLADGLSEPQHTQLQRLALAYVDAVVNHDWPQMAGSEAPQQSVGINTEMWKTVMSARAGSPTEQIAEEHALAELSALNQHRLTRLLQSTTRLPNVLWCVLLVGGCLTIIAACTLGVENVKLHMLQVFSFSLLISLSLVAIADIHRPFQGLIHVRDDAFRRAERTMQAR